MYKGKTIFSQVLEHLPMHTFRQCVERYDGNKYIKSFTCQDQYRCMTFAQLTFRESLRDIETCLRAQSHKLYHMGIRGRIARSTLADANETRDWRIYADFAGALIRVAQNLYADEDLGIELRNAAYALDTTTIDLCLSLFPWAHFKKTKAAIKLHTMLDLRGNIPTFIHITDGKGYDLSVLDEFVPEAGAFYVMDRGFTDFERLSRLTLAGAFFVIRARTNLKFYRLYSHPVDKSTGLRCDQTVRLSGRNSNIRYPDKLRRIKFRDPDTDKTFVFLTNNFSIPAFTITEFYRLRWQIELFFKWIKQHLRIKSFFGTSENAVKTQVWIAVSVYVLIAIIRKRLTLEASLYTILQILSLTVFEKIPLDQSLKNCAHRFHSQPISNQLNIFDEFPGQ